jgi:hypothetical protein
MPPKPTHPKPESPKPEPTKSWWETFPGIATATAALIGALTTAFLAIRYGPPGLTQSSAPLGSPFVHWEVHPVTGELDRGACDATALDALTRASAKDVSRAMEDGGEIARTGVVGSLTGWAICVGPNKVSLIVVGAAGEHSESARKLANQLALSFGRWAKQ